MSEIYRNDSEAPLPPPEAPRDDIFEKAGETLVYTKAYAQNQLDIYKLIAIEKGAKVGSLVISIVIAVFLAIFFLTFFLLTLSFVINLLVDSLALSFGIVTLLILGLTWAVFHFRKRLFTNPLVRMLANTIYND